MIIFSLKRCIFSPWYWVYSIKSNSKVSFFSYDFSKWNILQRPMSSYSFFSKFGEQSIFNDLDWPYIAEFTNPGSLNAKYCSATLVLCFYSSAESVKFLESVAWFGSGCQPDFCVSLEGSDIDVILCDTWWQSYTPPRKINVIRYFRYQLFCIIRMCWHSSRSHPRWTHTLGAWGQGTMKCLWRRSWRPGTDYLSICASA